MTTKRKVIKRSNASELRPKSIKPFSIKRFIEVATKLEAAVEKEEKKYGKPSSIFA